MSISHSVLLVSVLNSAQLSSPTYLSKAIRNAVAQTRKTPIVIVFSPLFSPANQPESLITNPVKHWREVQNLLTFIYVEASRKAQEIDNILLSVDVALRESGPQTIPPETLKAYGAEKWESAFILDGDDEIPLDDLPISSLPTTIFQPTVASPAELLNPPSASAADPSSTTEPFPPVAAKQEAPNKSPANYPVVALGGTFDHLHAGHKILLSVAAWLATDKVIVGVTDESLLVKKSNRQVLETISTRISSVRAFCTRFEPSLEYDILPISDVYGPTAWDGNIQALVLSYETREGAAAIAKLRAEKSLSSLDPYVIDVISSQNTRMDPGDAVALKHGKMSSTAIREWIVKHGKESEA